MHLHQKQQKKIFVSSLYCFCTNLSYIERLYNEFVFSEVFIQFLLCPFLLQAWMSICVIVVQYCVPCALVTFYYISICRFLAARPILVSDERQKQILAKRRKNNRMLIAVTVAHFTSWLPLNMINIILTMFDSDESPLFTNVEHLYIAYAMCHLASMTSAISNPVLYGFMNDNFRGEFDKIWQRFSKCKKVETSDDNNEAGIELGTHVVGTQGWRRQGSENITMVELKTQEPTEV